MRPDFVGFIRSRSIICLHTTCPPMSVAFRSDRPAGVKAPTAPASQRLGPRRAPSRCTPTAAGTGRANRRKTLVSEARVRPPGA